MRKALKIGIVGCGAIGSSLAKAIAKDFPGKAQLVALYDVDIEKSRRLSRLVSKFRRLEVVSLKQLIIKSDLVIEASSSYASFGIAEKVLSCARDIMIMSVGGILGHMEKFTRLADKHRAHIYIPSGAISGIDALKAARLGNVKKVTLTTKKNPASFKGVEYIQRKRIDLNRIKKDTVLFYDSAKKAVKFFPQNINVAGILSLAGLGGDRTRVKIIASPSTKKNIHEIHIVSAEANIFTRTENIHHPDNPKTSYLAVLSAIATLKQILNPIKIGT